MGTGLQRNRKLVFFICTILVVVTAVFFIVAQKANAQLDVLPILNSIRNHEVPKRQPGTFAEDFTENASSASLIFNEDNSFTFKYKKSKREGHAFSGCFFPLENVELDFSQYDKIDLGFKSNLARRIPFNLSVQNKKETHQYIRNFIEVVKGQTEYTLLISEFYTPTSWYERNNIAQVEIPSQDLAKIEALSFESCQLIEKGIADEFTISKFILIKDLKQVYLLTISIVIVFEFVLAILFLGLFRKKTEVVHIPIKSIEIEESQSIESKVMAFMAENYTNPNLSLNDLKVEFGKGNAEVSKVVKEATKLSFPKYLSYLRIEEAKRILIGGNFETVAEVGYIVGFNSPSNFIRVFKNLEGVSPKKFLDDRISKE